MLTAIFSIVGAHWPGPYKRFAESLAAFIPVAAVQAGANPISVRTSMPRAVRSPAALPREL